MRAVMGAFALTAFVTTATVASACTIVLPPRLAGETLDQAAARATTLAQANRWEAAEAVYLGQVVAARQQKGDDVLVFAPTVRLKGAAPPRRATYREGSGYCGSGVDWKVGDAAVLFASRIGWRDNLRRMGQWFVLDAIPPHQVLAPKAVEALKASGKQPLR